MNSGRWKPVLAIGLVLLLSVLVGCASNGLEYAPKGPYLYYHQELPAAERAIEAARAAGKDSQCPEEFKAAEKLKNDAYTTYWACRTNEAIALANEAVRRAQALCPVKALPAPPPPPPPLPTLSLAASPTAIP